MSQPMFGGERATTSTFKYYTGLGTIKLGAVNPTKEELSKLLGRDISWEVQYNLRENSLNGRMERPITFWVTSDMMENPFYVPLTFLLSNEVVTSQSGKTRFVDKLGQTTYYADSVDVINNNPKVTWLDNDSLESLHYGEENIYNFMQKLIRYSPKAPGANWRKDLQDNGMTFESLYNGDIEGLKRFVGYTIINDYTIIGMFVVSKRTSFNDNGEEVIKLRQDVLSNTDTFFPNYGKIDDRIHKRMRAIITNREEEGLTLTTKYYTIGFQAFVEEECANYVADTPEDVITPINKEVGTSDNSWLS